MTGENLHFTTIQSIKDGKKEVLDSAYDKIPANTPNHLIAQIQGLILGAFSIGLEIGAIQENTLRERDATKTEIGANAQSVVDKVMGFVEYLFGSTSQNVDEGMRAGIAAYLESGARQAKDNANVAA